MARVTRSKTGSFRQEDTETDTIPTESQLSTRVPIQSSTRSSQHKKRKIASTPENTPRLTVREAVRKLRPSYDSRPKKYGDNDMGFVARCESLITSNVLFTDHHFKNQIEDLKRYKLFKDMNNVDIRTVKLLQSDVGELNEKDTKMVELMSLGFESKEFDTQFRKLYGLDITEDAPTKQEH